MKLLSVILLLLSPIISNCQIDGTWLAIESRIISSSFISPIDGSIFHFEDQKLLMKHVYYDTLITQDFEISNDTILISDSLKIEIDYISKDSMRLKFDSTMLSIFVPLNNNGHSQEIAPEDLMDNTWFFINGDVKTNLYFLREPWEPSPLDISKICIVQKEGGWYGSYFERWSLSQYLGTQLLCISTGQFTEVIYKIIEANDDQIILDCLTYPEEEKLVLNRNPFLSKNKLEKLEKMLTNNKWETIEVIDRQHPHTELDSVIRARGYTFEDTLFITVDDFFNKLTSYEFTENHTYKLYLNDNLFISGTWQLLKDGKTLILDDGKVPESYLNILRLKKDKFDFSSNDKFASEPGGHEYEVYHYIVKTK